MDQELINQIHEEAREAVRGYRNRALAAFVLILVAYGYLFNVDQRADIDRQQDAKAARAAIVESGNIVAISGCNQHFRDRQAIRAVLFASRRVQQRARKRGDTTRAQYLDSIRFYRSQLTRLRLPDCRDTVRTLTDDPNRKPLVVPRPLYPK